MQSQTPKVGRMARLKKDPHPFDRHLGIAVRAMRTRRQMTQNELATATGIPLSNYQRREDGKNEVSVAEMERISVALGVPTREIVDMALVDYSDHGTAEDGLRKLVASVSEPARTVAPEDEIPYIGPVVVDRKHAAYTETEDEADRHSDH